MQALNPRATSLVVNISPSSPPPESTHYHSVQFNSIQFNSISFFRVHTQQQWSNHFPQQHSPQSSTARQVVQAGTAITLGGSLLTLSGLSIVGTVILLIIATPVMVLFSPVLVPAVITVGLIGTGFMASGGLGIAGATALTVLYKSVSGGRSVQSQLASKARDIKDTLQQPHRGAQQAS